MKSQAPEQIEKLVADILQRSNEVKFDNSIELIVKIMELVEKIKSPPLNGRDKKEITIRVILQLVKNLSLLSVDPGTVAVLQSVLTRETISCIIELTISAIKGKYEINKRCSGVFSCCRPKAK